VERHQAAETHQLATGDAALNLLRPEREQTELECAQRLRGRRIDRPLQAAAKGHERVAQQHFGGHNGK
jgi:hypothetical protein